MFQPGVTTAKLLFIAATLCVSAQALAQQNNKPGVPQPTNTPQGDKLDVSDLEKKYWAAKDTDFNVVQNRLFAKANRFSLSALYGNTINDAWSDGPTIGGSLNYYLNERYGIELAYTNTDSKDSDATARLSTQQGGFPNHNKMKQFYGIAMNWVPFYAKMSVLNSSIIYFDMSISPGLGMVEYEQQLEEAPAMKSAPAFTLDITQQFFLNNHFALRVDYKNRWYQEQITSFRNNASRTSVDETSNATLLMFGLTLFY